MSAELAAAPNSATEALSTCPVTAASPESAMSAGRTRTPEGKDTVPAPAIAVNMGMEQDLAPLSRTPLAEAIGAIRCLPKLQDGRLKYVIVPEGAVSHSMESTVWARCRA